MRANTPITIIGNLVADPIVKFTQAGHPVARVNVAVSERKYNKDSGRWEDSSTAYYTVQAWQGLAENLTDSLGKGDRVVVAGTLRQDHWMTDQGEQRSMWVLTADTLGPSLEYHTARPSKASRKSNSNGTPPSDDWATAEPPQ